VALKWRGGRQARRLRKQKKALSFAGEGVNTCLQPLTLHLHASTPEQHFAWRPSELSERKISLKKEKKKKKKKTRKTRI